jgi:hypothetical protein
MFDKLPSERQPIEVRLGNDWQPATYQDGQFIDAYGLPLDARKISGWRAPNGMIVPKGTSAQPQRSAAKPH